MSLVALQLKSNIESGIAATGRSILTEFTDPVTGLETEKFNFILLTEPKPEAVIKNEGTTTSASEVVIVFDGVETARPWNYLQSGDPRISGGVFAFPMGLYSQTPDFLSLYSAIENYEYSGTYPLASQANSLAMLASFYNLSATQIINAALGSGGNPVSLMGLIQGFVQDNMGLQTPILPPQYLEVLASIPIFPDGYSIAIMELDPTPPPPQA
jgi:hypothetical protein